MPEIFHSNELDGIIGIKKRLTKNLKKTFASEEPFGLTVGDAKGLDSLVSATEEIETNAQLVLSKLNKTGDFQSAEKQINNFYKAVRKGLNIVKNLKFTGLPRSDIEKLSNYLPSLEQYLKRFNESFEARNTQNNIPRDSANKKFQDLTDQMAQVEREYKDLQEQARNGVDVADEMNERERIYRLMDEERELLKKRIEDLMKNKGINLGLDYNLVFGTEVSPAFEKFIQLLIDGIASFNSGRTTQGNLGGSYMIGGEMPRRFM